jgi:hypothetical protein
VTVTVTGTVDNGNDGLIFTHNFNQSVGSAPTVDSQINGNTINPVVESGDDTRVQIILNRDKLSTGDSFSFEYSYIVANVPAKTVAITGTIDNGRSGKLDPVTYTITDTPTGGVDIDPGDLPGNGSGSNPYEISNVSELQAMEDDLDANYTLVSDIDASGSIFDPVGGRSFRESTLPLFSGSFDGNNHTVTGLMINRPNERYVGLFGSTNSGATLRNLTLIDITVTGGRDVGGLVGNNFGNITDANVSGNVTGSGFDRVGGLVGRNSKGGRIQNATAAVSVTGDRRVGGLVGENRGTIQNATAAVSVTGDRRVGGLVGVNGGGFNEDDGKIQNVRASGNVTGSDDNVGGLVGDNNGNIQTATAFGNVTGGPERVGGLIGENNRDGTVENARAFANVTGSGDSVGGLIGSNEGTVQTVRASGSVNGTGREDRFGRDNEGVGGLVGDNDGDIQNATAFGSVAATDTEEVGGLVGSNFGTVQGVRASGRVNGSDLVGGLAGENNKDGIIQNARASGSVNGGNVVGGLVGVNRGTIQQGLAVGSVSGEGDIDVSVGGLVGTKGPFSLIANSYWDTVATGQSISAGSAIGLITPQMQGQSAKTNMSGLAFGTSWQTQTAPNDYPILLTRQQEIDLPGNGSESSPYKISNISELQTVRSDLDANYELVNDISASQTAQLNDGHGFDPVGGDGGVFNRPFTGSLNGNNHTVAGLVINRSDERAVGLFGVSSGTLANITLTEVTVSGNVSVGGLVGINDGNIRSVIVSGTITGSGKVDRYRRENKGVGGLVGDNDGNIQNSTAFVSVNGSEQVGGLVGENKGIIKASTTSSSVNGTRGIGGLVGNNDGAIRNVTASGSVTATGNLTGGLVGDNRETIRNASASGRVSGKNLVGGLVGANFENGTIRGATASGNVSGENGVGGLIGSNIKTVTTAAASGSVTGSRNVGGLIGFNSGIVRDTFAVGVVSVPGDVDVGGLVGNNTDLDENAATVTNSYWDTEATGQSTSDGAATGLTTVQMQGQAAATNMNGLAFDTSWQIQTDPGDYPTLIVRTQFPDSDHPNPQPTPTASIIFNDQTVVNGSASVTVASAQVGNQSVPGEDFVVVIHETTSDREIGPKIGESPVLKGNQTQSNITVSLSTDLGSNDSVAQLTEPQELVATLHTADTGDGDNISHGSDDLGENPPVTDRARVAPLGLRVIDLNRSNINQPEQSVRITATVPNNGATNGSIQLTLVRDRDSEQLARSTVSVASGAIKKISFTVTPTQTEKFSIQGPAFTRSVTIDVAELNLASSNLITQGPVTTTETVVVSATVSNTGDVLGVIPLTLNQDGIPVDTITTDVGIEIGKTVTAQFSVSGDVLGEGTHNLTVTSSLDDQSADAGIIAVTVQSSKTPMPTVTPGNGSGGGGGDGSATATATETPPTTSTTPAETQTDTPQQDTENPTALPTDRTGTQNDGFRLFTAFIALLVAFLGFKRVGQE